MCSSFMLTLACCTHDNALFWHLHGLFISLCAVLGLQPMGLKIYNVSCCWFGAVLKIRFVLNTQMCMDTWHAAIDGIILFLDVHCRPTSPRCTTWITRTNVRAAVSCLCTCCWRLTGHALSAVGAPA